MADERVHLYTKLVGEGDDPCPYCDKAKAWLTEKGIPFTFEELGPQGRVGLYNELNLEGASRLVPQVMVIDVLGEEHRVGGYEDLIVSNLESLFRKNSVTA